MMKKIMMFLLMIISINAGAQKNKTYTAQDLMPSKKRTCWTVTSGKAAFGNEIFFNTNQTAQHATGGFGAFKIEAGNDLVLVDLNGRSTDSQVKLHYKILSLDKTKLVLQDAKGTKIELAIKK